MNNPKVTLLNITQDIPSVMSKIWLIAKEKTPLERMNNIDVDAILIADLPTSEFITSVWCIENMPRAFWDQLDRHRHAAFWEQSVRILDLSHFAVKGEYWVPDSLEKDTKAETKYRECMHTIQKTYNDLIKARIPSEDARGVLPLHINVRGTMCINLRALKGMMASRTCWIAQGSMWQPIIMGMALELGKHLSKPVLKSLFNLPCYKKSACPIESNVVTRLTDEDANPCCPIYLKRFAKDKEAAKEFTLARHPNYPELAEKYFEFIRGLDLEES